MQRDTRELCLYSELAGKEPAPVQEPRRICLHCRLQADVSSLRQHSELAGRVVAVFTVAQSHFWKKQKTKNNSILGPGPAFLIKLWVWASRCLYNLHCTARQGLLVQAQCFPNCSFADSRPYVQQTLPAKDTHSYFSTPPILN